MHTICPLIIVLFLVSSYESWTEASRQKFDRRHLSHSSESSSDPENGNQEGNELPHANQDSDHDSNHWSQQSKSREESPDEIPDEVRKWLKKARNVKRVVRRPSLYQDSSYRRGTSLPPLPSPSNPFPSVSSHDSSYGDSQYSGVYARWNNPRLNWTSPYFGYNPSPSASSEFPNYATTYPEYQTSASDYDGHHIHHSPHVQYIPYPVSTCHEHHGKKKEIGYIWPLILLGLLFLPFLFGALLVPLVLVFFTNLIQLVSLILAGQAANTAGGAGVGRRRKKRKKRDLHGTLTSLHPMIMDKIEEIGHQLDDSLHEFLESSWFKHPHSQHRNDSDYSSLD